MSCAPCPPVCESVFDRVVVSHLAVDHVEVRWTLLPTFTEPGPLTFQLQAAPTFSPESEAWQDVGAPVTDFYYAADTEQHDYGKTRKWFYRVRVISQAGEHFSLPVGAEGTLDRSDWLKARNVVRRKRKTLALEAQDGHLLKRRVSGQECPRCTDYQTGDTADPQCPTCYGTGFVCGYYYPIGCVWASLEPRGRGIKLDEQEGSIESIAIPATMLMVELMETEDIWVADKTDARYSVQRILHTAEVRGVPLIGKVELRPIPLSSRLYEIPIPHRNPIYG